MNRQFLVVTDMDHTLLLPGKPISPANLQAVEYIRSKGGILTFATGRTPFLTGIYTDVLKIEDPIIACNGAEIFDPVTRKDIKTVLLPPDLCLELIRRFDKDGSDATGYSPEGMFLSRGSRRQGFIDRYNTGIRDEIRAVYSYFTDDIIDGRIALPAFSKFLLIEPSEDTLEFVKGFDGIDVVSSAGGYYDIMMKGISKGNALLEIADLLGIPRERTVAFGDSENDLSMIINAGIGVAMGNSDPRLFEAADHITSTCAEDGFSKAILEADILSAFCD